MSETPHRFGGIIPPMITPLVGRDELDVSGLGRLVEHVIAGGVHGIFVLGTTGEGPSVSARLKRELVTRTVELARARVPVVVGVTDCSFAESVHLARHAAECGAAALVVAAPYYFPAGQPEIIEYLRHLCPELPLPVLLYNIPATTKIMLAPETVAAAAEIENVVGIKDSSGDAAYFDEILGVSRASDGFVALMGEESLLAEAVTKGASGGVPSGANVHPRLYVRLYEAARRGDGARVRELSGELQSFQRIYRHGHHWSSVIKGVKCSLSLMGICDDFAGEPFHRFREPERKAVADDLGSAGLFEEYGRGLSA